MPNEIPQPERELIIRLGIITQEIALLQADLDKRKSSQKALVVSLVQREMISQSRASRIAEVQRSTIARWLQEAYEAPLSEEDRVALRYQQEINRD